MTYLCMIQEDRCKKCACENFKGTGYLKELLVKMCFHPTNYSNFYFMFLLGL